MNISGSWDPNQGEKISHQGVSLEALELFVAIAEKNALENIDGELGAEAIQQHRHLMREHKDEWSKAADSLDNDEIIHLIRFFTLAEMQLPGWDAGSLSPVIWLCRALKQRGAFPDKVLIEWIKANTENKFLPYGNILDF